MPQCNTAEQRSVSISGRYQHTGSARHSTQVLHSTQTSPANPPQLIKIGTILYSPFLAAAKFSLLFFYLRLSRLRWFRIAIFASMLLVVGSNIGLVFPYIFACTPVSKIHGSCLDPTPIHIASGALNVTTNILLLGLPIPVVLKWKTSGLERAGVLCIFGVGIATCAASIIRLALTYPMLQATDQTWAIVTPSLYTLIEANLIIITITLPTARLFLHHIAPTLISAPHLQPSNQPPGPTPHITRPNRLDIELTTTCSSSKPARKRYSRMTNDSASIISAGELSSWKAEVGSRKSVVTIPSPALDRSLSRKSVGTIVKTRTTTVTSELVPDLGEYERRASWAPPF